MTLARLSSSLVVLALGGVEIARAQPADGGKADVPAWLQEYASKSGLDGPAPGEPGGTRTAAPTPTPYDTGWFTDADQLTVPREVRRYLDQALAPGASASDVRGLRWLDVDMATPEEKARLVERALATGANDWVVAFFQHYRPVAGPFAFFDRTPDGVTRPRGSEGARTLEVLTRRGALLALANVEDEALYAVLPEAVTSAAVARPLVMALAAADTRARRLAVHHVFDQARAGKFLAATLEGLSASTNAALRELAAQATPTRRFEVICHRADPITSCENTLPAVRSAAERGGDGVEIDLCVTADGQIVLWHDEAPGAMIAVLRNVGLEGGMGYRPMWPGLGSPFRRPIHELTLAEVRQNLGYARKDDQLLPGREFQIPTLDEVAALLAVTPSLRRNVLDIKLPPGDVAVHERFARRLKTILERYPCLRERVVLMNVDEQTVLDLKRVLGPALAYTLDLELNGLVSTSLKSAVGDAQRLGNRVASAGRPILPKVGGEYTYYLDVLRADRARIDQGHLDVRFLSWTIDDELEMREILAIGVDGLITNVPDLLMAVRRKLGLTPR